MDDFSFWWYIIAAVIYFLTRSKKKKTPPARPGTENNPPQTQRPKSFEELLKEITEGPQEVEEPRQEPVVVKPDPTFEKPKEEKSIRLEGERRMFADDESRKIYEESIKMAEGADLEFKPNEHYRSPRIFKGPESEEEESSTFADEIRDGLNSDEAKKAIIYAEILNRKY